MALEAPTDFALKALVAQGMALGDVNGFDIDEYKPTGKDILDVLEKAAEGVKTAVEPADVAVTEKIMNEDEEEALKDERTHKPSFMGVMQALGKFRGAMTDVFRMSKGEVGEEALRCADIVHAVLTKHRTEFDTADYEALVDNLEVATRYAEILAGKIRRLFKETTGQTQFALSPEHLPYSPHLLSFGRPGPVTKQEDATARHREMQMLSIPMDPVLKKLVLEKTPNRHWVSPSQSGDGVDYMRKSPKPRRKK